VGTSTICRQWGACPNAVYSLTCGFVGFLPNLMKLIDIVPPSSLTSFLPQNFKIQWNSVYCQLFDLTDLHQIFAKVVRMFMGIISQLNSVINKNENLP